MGLTVCPRKYESWPLMFASDPKCINSHAFDHLKMSVASVIEDSIGCVCCAVVVEKRKTNQLRKLRPNGVLSNRNSSMDDNEAGQNGFLTNKGREGWLICVGKAKLIIVPCCQKHACCTSRERAQVGIGMLK